MVFSVSHAWFDEGIPTHGKRTTFQATLSPYGAKCRFPPSLKTENDRGGQRPPLNV